MCVCVYTREMFRRNYLLLILHQFVDDPLSELRETPIMEGKRAEGGGERKWGVTFASDEFVKGLRPRDWEQIVGEGA